MIFLVVMLTACSGERATWDERRMEWMRWANNNKPPSPNIEVAVGIPATSIQDVIYIDMNAKATRWEIYVDDALVSEVKNSHLVTTLKVSEGVRTIKIVSFMEVSPPSDLQSFGPAVSSSELVYIVSVDISPPEVVLTQVTPMEKALSVSGILTDKSSGACCVIISGLDETITVDSSGAFTLLVPFEKIGVATSLTLIGYDNVKNATSVLVPVTLPPNRWERISPNGEWVSVNVTPGFNPFDVSIVGFMQLLKGYSGDYWVQYASNTTVGPPQREPASWMYLKAGVVITGLVVLLIVVGMVVWQVTALPRAISNAFKQKTVSTTTALSLPQSTNTTPGLSPKRTVRDQVNALMVRAFLDFLATAPEIRSMFAKHWAERGYNATYQHILGNGEEKKK